MKSYKMRLPFLNHRVIIFATLAAILFAASLAHPRAQVQDKRLPKRSGHINDFAEVLDAATKERLEAILEKLKDKTHFDLVVATVKSTGGADLYDYSLAVANDWRVGAPASADKSLLIVISADDGKFFSQVTRGARLYLPEGLVGEMGQRMREKIPGGGYGNALVAAVRAFAADRDGACARVVARNRRRHGAPRTLHQRLGVVSRLGRFHLFGCVERFEVGHVTRSGVRVRQPRRPSPTRASATSRGR